MLHVVSWNIDRGCYFEQVLSYLADTNADLILLQECDLSAKRSGFRNVSREIAQRLNMNYVFGVEFVELSQGESARHGQATLSRTQISNSRVLRFKNQSKFWKPRWFLPNVSRLQRRLGGRMALVTEFDVDRTLVAVYNLHLESRCGDGLRSRQMGEVLEDTRRYGPNIPVLIAGDFNCDVTQPAISEIIKDMQFRNSFAGKAIQPTIRQGKAVSSKAIDWILDRGPAHSVSPTVHASASGSDHFPMSLTLQLP